MNKSQLWNELKQLGNPLNLKWTSSAKAMYESIQQIYLQNELNTYMDFEPFIIENLAEDFFFPELFKVVKLAYLSELLREQIEKTKSGDFPIEWGYFDGKEDIKYKATSFDALQKQFNAISQSSSEFEDIEIDEDLFFYTKYYQTYVPRKNTVKKSKTGKGNDYQSCNIIDNEFIYCPPSDKCLIDCLAYGQTLSVETQEKIQIFLKKNKVYRYNIPSCHINALAKIIGVEVNQYRVERKELKEQYNEKQIILCLLSDHWIILKNYKELRKCYNYAVENITWTEKLIFECDFSVQNQQTKYHECEEEEAFNDTWIQDFEAYPDNVTGQFIPYATGFVCLRDVYRLTRGLTIIKNPVQFVTQFDDSDCIIKMLTHIDNITKRKSTKVEDKNGKQKNVTQKRNVYIYAHNGANFDSYFYLNVKGIKCENMVEKGGIMSMTLVGEQFKNANFVIKDTRKFLTSSLASLCQSFKIDEKYCKTSMNHDEVNALTWKSLKPIWSPYLDLDVISLSLIWIQFIQKMRVVSEKIDVKQYCSIAQLSYSVACRNQELPAFVDPAIRKFVQRANRGGRVIARKQKFETKNINKILELNGVSCIDDLVGKRINIESQSLINDSYQIAFDATSLYPSAMSLPNASYLDAQNCKAMTQEECEQIQQNPEQWRSKKFIIECDLYAPQSLQFVPLSIKTEFGAQFSTGNIKKIVVNDVDLFECFRFGYELKAVYQGIYSEPIQYGFIAEFVKKYFTERAKVKNSDSVLGDLYKLILNSAYGKFGQKRIDTQTKFTTKNEMENRSDVYTDDVSECIELGNGQICYKVKSPQSENEKLSPHHIAGYILAYSKQIMNNFILLLEADKQNLVNYMDTDSFYIDSVNFSKLEHIKDELGGGKNDYGQTKMIIKADYLGCKSKVCYLLDTKTMQISKKVTWKGISQSKFGEISQNSVERVKCGNDYISDITNWKKSKLLGVSIEKGCSKKLSIDDYCQKYDLINGIYEYKHIE